MHRWVSINSIVWEIVLYCLLGENVGKAIDFVNVGANISVFAARLAVLTECSDQYFALIIFSIFGIVLFFVGDILEHKLNCAVARSPPISDLRVCSSIPILLFLELLPAFEAAILSLHALRVHPPILIFQEVRSKFLILSIPISLIECDA